VEPHAEPWEAKFDALFPAYLLPTAQRGTLDAASAARLVQRVLGTDVSLARFRAATFVAAQHDALGAFATRLLPDLCRGLRGRTSIERREERGRLVGRLDAPRTLLARMRGSPEAVVSRVRERRFDHAPEMAVRALAQRLLDALRAVSVRARDAPAWAPQADAWIRTIRHSFERTALRRVDEMPFSRVTASMFEGQRHPAYPVAMALWEALRDAIDSDDPCAIARSVCRGALWPLERWQRFELVVALALAQAIEARLVGEDARWIVRHAVVDADRDEIVALEHPDGRRVRVFYNQSPLPTGARSIALARYFGNASNPRPDVTVIGDGPGLAPRAVVVEVKFSENTSYLQHGFDEALVYAQEYAPHLAGAASAVLVTPSRLRALPTHSEPVVAYGWPDWQTPVLVLDAVVSTVAPRAP
jgi:hypothetical protein